MTEFPHRNILLVRSCRNDFFLSVLKKYREMFPADRITLLLMPSMKKDEHLYELADAVLYFPDTGGGTYHEHPPEEWLDMMRRQQFRLGVLTLNNRHGEGYEPLKRLLFACGCERGETINHDFLIVKVKKWETRFPVSVLKRYVQFFRAVVVYLLSLCGIGLFYLAARFIRPGKE